MKGGRDMFKKDVWTSYDEKELEGVHALSEGYKVYISENKTERGMCGCCD